MALLAAAAINIKQKLFRVVLKKNQIMAKDTLVPELSCYLKGQVFTGLRWAKAANVIGHSFKNVRHKSSCILNDVAIFRLAASTSCCQRLTSLGKISPGSTFKMWPNFQAVSKLGSARPRS